MRIAVAILLVFCIAAVGHAENTVKVKQATISGETIKVGQGADIVQSRIKADRYVTSGYNYGSTSKGYYSAGGVTYIITYGPPTNGTGGYVVQLIEKTKERDTLAPQKTKTETEKKKQDVEYPVIDYTAINFDTSESELTKKFPRVKCEQMPNPQVRMCWLPVSKSESISYLYLSGKLININGHTRTEIPKPPQVSCQLAKSQFRACQERSGDDFVDCLARINAPPGCR